MANIIDQYGALDAQIKQLEEAKAKLKSELIARGIGVYEGDEYFVDIQEYDREQISAPLVRKLSNEEFVKQVTTIQHVKAVIVKPLEA